jgi:DNA-directed RNA polymerase specialized sigma24 family protein
MTSPQGMHPRTQRAPDGSQVTIQVDGGRGGDLDEVFAVLTSINKALLELEGYDPAAAKAVALHYLKGKTLRDIMQLTHVKSSSTVSARIARGEAFIAGVLKTGGVLR